MSTDLRFAVYIIAATCSPSRTIRLAALVAAVIELGLMIRDFIRWKRALSPERLSEIAARRKPE